MRFRAFAVTLLAGVLYAATASAAGSSTLAISGGVTPYIVVAGDTLAAIAARFGVYPSTLASDNHLNLRQKLQTGRELRIDNRHIVPGLLAPNQIVVNVPQRMAFYQDADGTHGYPVAVGRTTWQTPAGPFTVVRKEEDPAWHVPESIRAESARSGRILPAVVPPGPQNPLGHYWIGLSLSGIGVHGTPSQSSIYQTVTHGCIRLQRDSIADLYSRVALGTHGHIVYEPILIAVSGDDIYIEVHPDVYRRLPASPRQEARELAARVGLDERIDWAVADREIDARAGIARKVRLKPDPAP